MKARPKTPPRTGPRSEAAVLVRVSAEERERFKAAAAQEGLGVGPWLRMLGLRASTGKPS